MYTNLGIIGHPLKHTLSPFIHNYFLYHSKMNGGYNAFEIDEELNLSATIARLKKYHFLGVNITLPYKEKILDYVDVVDRSVNIVGACNTLKFINSKIEAYNTDLFGIVELFKTHSLDFSNKTILLLGAGGASRAVVYALNDYTNVKIFLVNRDQERAKSLISLSNHSVKILQYADIANFTADYAINSTSIGIVDGRFPDFKLKIKECAIDLQYGRKMTPFLSTLSDSKIKLMDGLDMLIFQAHSSFKIWTDITPRIDLVELRERLRTSL